jgi:hypothetical protein
MNAYNIRLPVRALVNHANFCGKVDAYVAADMMLVTNEADLLKI